jgi:hypothetical protein
MPFPIRNSALGILGIARFGAFFEDDLDCLALVFVQEVVDRTDGAWSDLRSVAAQDDALNRDRDNDREHKQSRDTFEGHVNLEPLNLEPPEPPEPL